MIKRIVLVSAALVVAMALIGSLVLWVFLSSWVPIQGKAMIIQELERHGPITVSIGSMRYELLRGFRLEDVQAIERTTQERWGAIPSIQIQVNWFPLVLNRRLVFHGRAVIERPCQTSLTFSGRYHLRDKSLALDAKTSEIPLRSLTAPLTRYVPPALTDGTLRLQFHLREPAQTQPVITGLIEGTGLVWTAPPWRLSGGLMVEGTTRPPSGENGRWSLQAHATLRHAALEGLPIAGSISQLEGTARVDSERLEIEELTGVMLGSLWKLEGLVTMGAQPSLDVLLRSDADLAPFAAAFPPFTHAWQPEGRADLRAACRGALQPSPLLDCLTRAELRGVTLAGSKLAQPLTHIAGSVGYDVLAHRLSIERLNGLLEGEPFIVSGEVNMAHPMQLALHVTGTLPLESLRTWLPAESPVDQLGGVAALNLKISGSSAAPQCSGNVELRDAAVRLTQFPVALERLTGPVFVTGNRIEIPRATLRLNDQPLTLKATITSLDLPRIVATVGFPQGQLQLTSRLTLKEVVIDEGRLSLNKSSLHISGTVGRTADRPSALGLSGAIELAELKDLPFFPLPQLDAWNLQGLAELDAQFQGSLSDWPGAAIRGLVRTDHVSIREIPLEQLMCTVAQRDRVLRLHITSTLIAEGKFAGALTIEHRPGVRNYLLEADLSGLQLGRLSQAIPSWRSRSVMGEVSSHAILSGTWEERSTWRGEGWLNASGERLGDVPLLDTLFQGLFGVLAERLGLETLRRAQITKASVQWQLSQERFRTQDLRLGGLAGTEPVAIYAKGSVGLDRTLDFVIEPELSEGVVLQAPATSTLASTVLKAAGQLERMRRLIGRHRLTGTLHDPEYRFEFSTQEIFKQLAPAPVDLLHNLLDAVR
jgi:hypothetical protein